MLGVVRMHELARAREMEIKQAREPEAKCSGAQQRGPCLMLGPRKRPHRRVFGEKSRDKGWLEYAIPGGIDKAPVVRTDRDVEQQHIDAREVVVEHAAQAPVVERGIVTEEVAVDRAPRQLGKAMPRLERHFRIEESLPPCVE